MQAALIPGRRTALWLALAAVILPSPALELGPAQVQSALGEKLDARIPLRAREGEWFHAKCLELTEQAIPGVPSLTDGTLSVERRRTSTNLRIRTAEPVNEPALAFSVTSNCSGAAQPVGPPVTLLIDPPRVDRAARDATRASPPVAVPPAPARVRSPAIAAQAPDAAPLPVPRAAAQAPAPSKPRGAPAKAVEPPSRADVVAPPSEAALPKAVEPTAARPAPMAPAVAPGPKARAGDFVLRLSSEPIDVARTHQLDDKSRARLRERLRLLDSDDQVAEMLSMRDNLRRLEARVAELQLKLAAAPPSFPVATPKDAGKPAATAPPPTPEPAKPEPAKVAAPIAAEPPKAVAAPAEPAKPAAAESPKPAAAEPPKPTAAVPPVESDKKPPVAQKPAEPPAEESLLEALQSLKGRLIAVGIATLLLLVFLGTWLWSRWRQRPAPAAPAPDTKGPSTAIMERDAAAAVPEEEPIEIAAPAGIEIAAPVRAEVTSDAALATRLGEDTEGLRRRYIEERFPEIRAGSIVMNDPGSIVKGARLFYEDGAMTRAVELLRFAVEARPAEVRPWLALFEIYRLERLPGEYGELAARFHERHGSTPQWPKVCSFGRELDPSNPLYQEPPLKSLETIGPADARRRAAAHADPLVENWLEAPMDFENEVLATDLRRSLMARAKVEERDLVPNPMPALRSVEMFSVG